MVGLARFIVYICLAVALAGEGVPATPRVIASVAINPTQLAIDVSAFPPGSVILQEHVDRTAAQVNQEGIDGISSKQGAAYAHFGFRGSVVEKARVPFNGRAVNALWIIASVFPSVKAAQGAWLNDARFVQCNASPALDIPERSVTCGYLNPQGRESGMYAVVVSGVIELGGE